MAAMCSDLPPSKSPEILQRELEEAAAGSASLPNSSDPERRPNSSSIQSSADDTYLLAKHILMADDLIDGMTLKEHDRQKILLKRTWLVHRAVWPLMAYYFPTVLAAASSNVGATSRTPVVPSHLEWTRLIEWLFSDRNINLVCTVCPHLLRYISVIAILNKQRQDHFKVAVDAVGRCAERYADPFTSILNSLFVKYDFEEAQEKLVLGADAAAADYFLAPLKNTLEESCRFLIFQTYCTIQKSINIDVIAGKLHMTPETAERWIVNLIRQTRIGEKEEKWTF